MLTDLSICDILMLLSIDETVDAVSLCVGRVAPATMLVQSLRQVSRHANVNRTALLVRQNIYPIGHGTIFRDYRIRNSLNNSLKILNTFLIHTAHDPRNVRSRHPGPVSSFEHRPRPCSRDRTVPAHRSAAAGKQRIPGACGARIRGRPHPSNTAPVCVREIERSRLTAPRRPGNTAAHRSAAPATHHAGANTSSCFSANSPLTPAGVIDLVNASSVCRIGTHF